MKIIEKIRSLFKKKPCPPVVDTSWITPALQEAIDRRKKPDPTVEWITPVEYTNKIKEALVWLTGADYYISDNPKQKEAFLDKWVYLAKMVFIYLSAQKNTVVFCYWLKKQEGVSIEVKNLLIKTINEWYSNYFLDTPSQL
jgi:hypothetical protein